MFEKMSIQRDLPIRYDGMSQEKGREFIDWIQLKSHHVKEEELLRICKHSLEGKARIWYLAKEDIFKNFQTNF